VVRPYLAGDDPANCRQLAIDNVVNNKNDVYQRLQVRSLSAPVDRSEDRAVPNFRLK